MNVAATSHLRNLPGPIIVINTKSAADLEPEMKMTRQFHVTLFRPVYVQAHCHRYHFIYTATEPAEALRLYYQDFPDGPEPLSVEAV